MVLHLVDNYTTKGAGIDNVVTAQNKIVNGIK